MSTRQRMRASFFEDLEAQQAIVDEDGVADFDVLREVLVIDLTERISSAPPPWPSLWPGRTVKSKISPARNSIGALTSPVRISGPLMSIMMRHFATDLGADGADAADHAAGPVVFCVGHVEADDVGAGGDHRLQHGLAFGRGSEGEDDLGAAERAMIVHAGDVCAGTGPGTQAGCRVTFSVQRWAFVG
jgi:hypothetical protein